MKNRNKYKKIVGSCIVMLCMMFALLFYVKDTEATDNEIMYAPNYTYTTSQYVQDGVRIAPEAPGGESGYLFAGWYTSPDQGVTYTPVAVPEDQTIYYAKFVPQEVLGMKAQITTALIADEATSGTANSAIRFVTTVDSDQYKEVGFNIERPNKDAAYDTGNGVVYKTLYAVDATKDNPGEEDKTYTPDMFHKQSEYFKTWTIRKIPDIYYDSDFTVRPYWITLDGTRVEGTQGIKTVNLGRSWIYVDSTSESSAELGTLSAPYKTIANAVGHDTTLEPKIFLNSDTTINSKISISKDVTLTTKVENGVTVKRTEYVNMFEVGFDETKGDVTLEISGKITLDGNKSKYADATHMIINRGIFILGKDAVIQNASRSGDAAAIYSNEELVINGTIQNCVNTNADKVGAVKVVKGSLSGSGTFKDNTSAGSAGVISMDSGTIATFTNAVFSNNQSGKNGGAIGNAGSITATKCTFDGNYSSSGNGGAIYNLSGASKLDISESDFTNNYCSKSNMSGGAINCASTKGITINVTDTTFSNNHTTNAGGAIMVSNNADTASTLNLSNCKYEGNYTTSGDGGAIYTYGKITGTSCEFSDNHANNKGGAIALRRTTSSLTLQMDEDETRGAISSNYSNTGNGGAIFVHSDVVGTISITGYDFTNNTAGKSTTNKVNGGSIWNESSKDKVVICDSTFTSNTTTNVGGAIGSNASFTMDKCIFKENIATNNASYKDIYVPSGISSGTENISADEAEELRVIFSSDVHYTDQLTYYQLTKEERMEYWKKCILAEHAKNPIDLVVVNGDISLDYWVGQEGNGDGALFENPSAPTTQEFVTNYVQPLRDVGIPVFVMPGNHEHYNNDTWFEMTGNNRQGYMVLKNNLFLFMDNYVESDPESDDDGVYTPTDVSYINKIMNQYPLCDVYIVSHYFDWQGGEADNSEFKQLVAENSRIKGLIHGHTHNSEVWKLGAEGGYKTIINTGHFSGSSDQTYNAYWGFSELIVSPEGAYSQFVKIPKDISAEPADQTFERINKVLYTQKVDTYDELVSTINNATYACTIEIPQSFEMSDGITMSGKNFTLISKAMDGITLTRTTGASMFTVESGSRFKISGKITLDGNKTNVTSGSHGIINRGIFTLGGYATIQNAEKSDGNGGAIWNSGTLIVDGTLQNNSASVNGGAIYNQGSITATGCTFTGNHTTNAGGAIFVDSATTSKLEMLNCTFDANYAKTGGAIYTYASITGTSCIFSENYTTAEGGAIYIRGASNNLTLNMNDDGDRGVFKENYSNNNSGGAIFVKNDLSGTISVTGYDFIKNKAGVNTTDKRNGGAICIDGSSASSVSIINSTFDANETNNAGGAIRCADTLTVENCKFRNNIATNQGGAIHGDLATIKGKYYFEGNTGGSTYNGIHNDKAELSDGATPYDSWDAE